MSADYLLQLCGSLAGGLKYTVSLFFITVLVSLVFFGLYYFVCFRSQALIGSLLLTTVVLEVPFVANAFGFTPVSWTEYGIALGLAVLVIPVVEIVKACQRAHGRRKKQL